MTSAATEVVPQATPATADLICWIWAAVPPKEGRVHVSRAARSFRVSERTMRRWIRAQRELDDTYMRRAKQLAILRGHGVIQWPTLDPASAFRADAAHRYANHAAQLITNDPARIPPSWQDNGYLEEHQVLLVYWPRARVYTVNVTRTRKSRTRITSNAGVILNETTAPNLYAANLIKYRTLETHAEQRCITPRVLVPSGRTEAWRQLLHQSPPQLVTDD